MISKEEAEEIKEQLIEQIEKTFSSPQKEKAIESIEAMNEEQLEQFLIKNNMMRAQGGQLEQTQQSSESQPQAPQTQQCIFCSISHGKMQSYKLDENKDAVAVLDINPLSDGHSIVVPKAHATLDKIPSKVLTLAKKVAKRIKSKLKPQDVEISTSNVQGHSIVNVIPVYKDKKLEKKQAKPEELMRLQVKLETKPKQKKEKKKKEEAKEGVRLPQAPRRIP